MATDMQIMIERMSARQVVLRTEVLSDNRLSWAARGIHAYLFATWPEGFDVKDILLNVTARGTLDEKHHSDRIKRLNSYCLELEQFGYAKREQRYTDFA